MPGAEGFKTLSYGVLYTLMEPRKKILIFVSVIILIILALIVYFFYEKKSPQDEILSQYSQLIPEPPKEVYKLSGTVRAVYGGTIDFEIEDPDDYLPHPDGTPRKKQVRFVFISSDTLIERTDYSHTTPQGLPTTTKLSSSDLKVGDVITVHSTHNIRDTKQFDATKIQVIDYE